MQMEPVIPTDPEALAQIDQLDFLNHLKEWSLRYRGKRMTNDEIAVLGMTTLKVVETWRCNPSTNAYRAMQLQDKVLIALRLMESVRRFKRNSRMSDWETACFQHYAEHGVGVLTHITGRHSLTITTYLANKGIGTTPLKSDWSEEEDAFLRDHYKTMTVKAMAEKLQRTPAMVTWRKQTLGLRRYKQ